MDTGELKREKSVLPKRIKRVITSNFFITAMICLLQIGWLLVFLTKLSMYHAYANVFMTIISILVVLWLVNKWENPAYKLAWVIPILLFPAFGGLLYIVYGNKRPTKKIRFRLSELHEIAKGQLPQDEEVLEKLKEKEKGIYHQAYYITNSAGYPIWNETDTAYFTSGEDYYESLLKDLRNAKHYIFLEFFILEPGIMWNQILEILRMKVEEGVKVRIIYDGWGCAVKVPPKYYRYLESLGMECVSFNPFRPIFSLAISTRDHRKIVAIDGEIAYTGGMNLADEYVNLIHPYGKWKDAGIRLEGRGAWSFSAMFLEMWNLIRKTEHDFSAFLPKDTDKCFGTENGLVQPYGDSPLDNEIVGENIYLNIINTAIDYVYIMTPYLIVDNEMITALTLAAKRGVDVRIIVPGIPDKKMVYLVTQSYFGKLIQEGIKIYKYTPGFIHSKCLVSDDKVATVGTINFDFRSLYLHFEDGVFLCYTDSVLSVKEDAQKTFEESKMVTEEDLKNRFGKRMIQSLLRLFAPLI